MRRILFAIAAVVSVICFVAACILWARSFYVQDTASACDFTVHPDCDLVKVWRVSSCLGGLKIERDTDSFKSGDGVRLQGWKRGTYSPTLYPFFGTISIIPGRNHRTLYQRLGFDIYNWSEGTPPSIIQGVILPYWFVAVLFGFLSPVLILKWRMHRRILAGCCSRCGYDLRATPDRCPECGTAPTASLWKMK
jgi:hypothetical protein